MEMYDPITHATLRAVANIDPDALTEEGWRQLWSWDDAWGEPNTKGYIEDIVAEELEGE